MNKEYNLNIKEIILLSKELINIEQYNDIYNDYYCGEEEVALDYLLFLLNEKKEIPYKVGKLLDEFLKKYPADGTYLRKEPVDEFFRKLENAKICFE